MSNRHDPPPEDLQKVTFEPPAHENPFYPTSGDKSKAWVAPFGYGVSFEPGLSSDLRLPDSARSAASDETIKAEVYAKIDEALGLDASIVDVDVADGKVRLVGLMPSDETRELVTQLLGAIPGVRSIAFQLLNDN